MHAMEIAWLHPAYRYCYEADLSGKGCVKLTLWRQLRALNRLTAHWYRKWQAHNLLEELYGVVVAASRPCSCYMPDCVRCAGGDMASASIVAAEAEAEVDCSDTEQAAPLHLTGIAAARGSTSAGKRKRKRCPKPGHVRCTLAQELEEDRKGSQAESFDARIAVLASVCILMLQPALSALECIRRPCGER